MRTFPTRPNGKSLEATQKLPAHRRLEQTQAVAPLPPSNRGSW